MTEDDLFAEDGTDLSREFLHHRERGQDPFCERPWHTLKIHMNKKTRVCCDFFTWLPEFEFPTAKDFHHETGMWNHPFMQHMRGTMGLPDEVAFCTLCLTADKRDPTHRDRRIAAMSESKVLYLRLENERRQSQMRGTLSSAPEDLSAVSLRDRLGEAFNPFSATKSAYRKKVAGYGFFPRRRVLFLECAVPGWAPFLGEVSEVFVAADFHAERVARTVDVCQSFGIEAVEYPLSPDSRFPDFEDGYFDGIWVDGRQLVATTNPIPLDELRRVLSPGGTLHCHNTPGPGQLLHMLSRERNPDRSAKLLEQLRAGPDRQRRPQFFTRDDLRRILRDHGLAPDTGKPIYGTRKTIEDILGVARLEDDDVTRLKQRYCDAQELIDVTLSFSAERR